MPVVIALAITYVTVLRKTLCLPTDLNSPNERVISDSHYTTVKKRKMDSTGSKYVDANTRVATGKTITNNPIEVSARECDQSSLDSDFEDTVPDLFSAVSNGLPPAISTEMFRSSMKSVKPLTELFDRIFSYGLETDQLEIAVVLSKQFYFHQDYPRALVRSIDCQLKRADLSHLSAVLVLVVMIQTELESEAGLLTPVLVTWLVALISPVPDKQAELVRVKAARLVLQQQPSIILSHEGTDSNQSIKFLFDQVKAGLISGGVGAQARLVRNQKRYSHRHRIYQESHFVKKYFVKKV